MTNDQSCPMCHGPRKGWFELPHVWHQPKGTKPFAAYWCAGCEFGSLVPRPSPEELRNFYDSDYFGRYAGEIEDYQGQVERVPDPRLLDRLRVHLAWRADRSRPLDTKLVTDTIAARPARICDIGCGTGDLMVSLKDLGYRVVGVEPSDDARQRAMARGLDVHPGAGEALPPVLERHSFDGVVMHCVLDHCYDPLKTLRNAADLLAKGGYLLLDVSNFNAILSRRSGPAWFFGDAGRRVSFFTPKSLTATVERSNLKLVTLFYTSYAWAFANGRAMSERIPWDLLYDRKGQAYPGQTPRNSSRRQWGTLARTVFASPAKKYECVGVIAQRAE